MSKSGAVGLFFSERRYRPKWQIILVQLDSAVGDGFHFDLLIFDNRRTSTASRLIPSRAGPGTVATMPRRSTIASGISLWKAYACCWPSRSWRLRSRTPRPSCSSCRLCASLLVFMSSGCSRTTSTTTTSCMGLGRQSRNRHRLEIIQLPMDAQRWICLPKRWLVERSFGWFLCSRPLEH